MHSSDTWLLQSVEQFRVDAVISCDTRHSHTLTMTTCTWWLLQSAEQFRVDAVISSDPDHLCTWRLLQPVEALGVDAVRGRPGHVAEEVPGALTTLAQRHSHTLTLTTCTWGATAACGRARC